MRNVLIAAAIGISLAVVLNAIQNPAQNPTFLGSGVNVTSAGVIRVDSYTCYGTQMVNGVQQVANKVCPVRVEFGEEVSDNVLVCRSTKTGQICSTLGKLIPVK